MNLENISRILFSILHKQNTCALQPNVTFLLRFLWQLLPYPLAAKRKRIFKEKPFFPLSSWNFHDRLVSTWTLTRLNRTLWARFLEEILAVLSTTTLCRSKQGWNHAKRFHKLFLVWNSVNQKLRQCQKPSTIPVNAEHDFQLVLLLKTSCD